MKKIILFTVTALLFSSNSFGQLIEISLKGGVCANSMSHKFDKIANYKAKGNLGYAAGLSGTVGFGGYRAGISISALRVSAYLSPKFGVPMPDSLTHSLGNPLVPIEAMFIKRTKIAKISIDIGIMGGICVNNRYVNSYEDGRTTTSNSANTNWFTYGGILSGQYNISKRLAVGIEAQPKWIRLKRGQTLDNTFLLPVMAKVSARL